MNSLILLERLVQDGVCLTVLDLSHSNIKELPNSIADIKHLRYLDLTGTGVRKKKYPIQFAHCTTSCDQRNTFRGDAAKYVQHEKFTNVK